MLTITLSATDDEPAVELHFEHSLISLSKWESIYKKAFFGKDEKNAEEGAAYIKCMLIDENVPDEILNRLSPDNITAITDYINDKQSATWFREDQSQKGSNEVITSELIYYWLVQFNIPFEVETWHLNRLMTLVKIAGIKQTKPKPMSKAQQAEQYRRLNAERRARMNSSG
jgi:hypothetical protein